MAGNESILIRNAVIYSPSGCQQGDMLVSDGVVVATGSNLPSHDVSKIIDADGLTLLPGLVDLHVHFREPGYSYKETVRTGSLSAAAGGFTTVCTMPNVNPVPDDLDSLRSQLDIIESQAVVEVLPYASITKKRMGGELVDYDALAPHVAGFSDDGTGVQSEIVMADAMSRIASTGKILAAHCEVDSMLRGGYIHDGEYARAHGHRGICSQSEWREVARDIMITKSTGCPLHICHVSSKESVELVRLAKKVGLPVTCETGPHYLAFTDADLQEDGRWKMNPPIRSEEDREALRQGLADGTVDVIATDHAPHSADEKSRGLEKSAMGVVGLETSLAAVYTYMVLPGIISFDRMVDAMALRPRRLFGIKGGINPGDRADMTLVDFNAEWTVDPDKFLSMGRATPFDGCKLKGKVMATLAAGRVVYDALNK